MPIWCIDFAEDIGSSLCTNSCIDPALVWQSIFLIYFTASVESLRGYMLETFSACDGTELSDSLYGAPVPSHRVTAEEDVHITDD